MRGRKISLFLTGLVSSFLTMFSLASTPNSSFNRFGPIPNDRLIIAVVGDGVPSFRMCEPRNTPLNRAQGAAMWEGARLAFDSSSATSILRSQTVLIGFDDCSDSDTAAAIAEMLKRTPNVLAVIGHATSSTSRVAASIYAEANIPILMPIATSPLATVPLGAKQNQKVNLTNCVRIAPADDRVQAPAVAYVARQKLGAQRALLIRDETSDAITYSQPLATEIARRMGNRVRSVATVNRDQQDWNGLFLSLDQDSIDLIIFVGYTTTAQKVLNSLLVAKRLQVFSSAIPRVLMTDGCMDRELDMTGLEVYLTFPVPPIELYPNVSTDWSLLKRLVDRRRGEQSYELYSFDAMLLLAKVVRSCSENRISRDCVAEQLSRSQDVSGSCFSYSFIDGENRQSRYFVYYADGRNSQLPVFTFLLELNDSEINFKADKD